MSATAPRWRAANPFNRVAAAGPMRFVIIGGCIVLVAAVVIATNLISTQAPLQSSAARPLNLNPLPGGPNSTPLQNRVALAEDQRQAVRAEQERRSYTPPLAASQPVQPVDLVLPPVLQPAPPVPRPQPPPARLAVERDPTPPRVTLAQQVTPQMAQERPVQPGQPIDDPAFRNAVQGLLAGWGARPPQTTVTLPAAAAVSGNGRAGERQVDGAPLARRLAGEETPSPPAATQTAAPGGRAQEGQVLVPAGRGIYAHTITATNSEAGGPVVLQADTGPLAGARMMGTFTRAGMTNRLIVRVTSINYQGHTISVDGLVVAPDTMETSVATSVDQRLAERILLPAAAAFVEGLGQAIARANSTTFVSPFGGGTVTSRLNTEEQLGVAAGAAGARIGQILEQSTPQRATVHLARGAAVGVLFLSDVTLSN
jgi:intracellular multiplication protein IcmE